MLNLINRFARLVSNLLEARLDQQSTGDMIALNARFATLTGFNSS